MVLVNYSTRELTAKLVFYGPGLCGKTTNLQYIYDSLLPKDRRGKMVSLSTETDRTLFFDFLPLELGTIRGLKTRLQLYTVPGQVHYNATRKIVLKGADGIVFVADSQASKRDGNIESFRNMKANLAENGLDLRNIPHVLQFNKRDLPDIMSIDQMVEDLNEFNSPFFEAVAFQGIGVEDTLKGISKLVLKNLAGRFQPGSEAAQPAAAPAPVAPLAAAPAPVPAPAPPVMASPVAAPPVMAPAFMPPPVAAPPVMAPAASAGLEDLLLGAPAPAPAPAQPMASDVFGGIPAASAPALGGRGLEDMLLGAPGDASEPEIQELELPSPEEEAMLRGMVAPPAPAPAAADLEASLIAGDTVMTPLSPAPGAPAFAPTAKDYEFDSGMLSGDTVLSASPGAPFAPIESGPAPEPIALGGGDEYEIVEEEPLPLSADEVVSSPEADLLAAPAPMLEAPAAPGAFEVPVTLALGSVQGGEVIERVLRVPVSYTDASGQRQTTLEVTLRFKLD